MFWFFRGIRKGIVTTSYPNAVEPWARDLPSPPTFDSEHLTDELADHIVAVCPNRALRKEANELVLDIGSCTGCGHCFGEAVMASGEFELASHSREQLIKRIPIGGRK